MRLDARLTSSHRLVMVVTMFHGMRMAVKVMNIGMSRGGLLACKRGGFLRNGDRHGAGPYERRTHQYHSRHWKYLPTTEPKIVIAV
jgi:hypothetical protein